MTGDDGAAAAECADGTSYRGAALIAADGLHSGIRALFSADQPVCSGFAAYRGTARIDEVTARSELDEVVAWNRPGPALRAVPAARRADLQPGRRVPQPPVRGRPGSPTASGAVPGN